MRAALANMGGAPPVRRVAFGAAWAGAAVLFGFVYAYMAFNFSPLVLPVLAVGVGLAIVTVTRPEVGIAAALVLSPLQSIGGGGGVVKLFLLAWSVFLFTLALLNSRHRPAGKRMPFLVTAVLLYLAMAVVAFALASDPTEARRLLRTLVTGLLLFGTTAVTVRTRSQVGWILGGATIAALLVGGLATTDYLRGTGSTGGFLTDSGEVVSRVTAGFAHPNQLGGFLVLLVPMSLAGMVLYRKMRWIHAAAVALAIGGIYASFSRGALIGLALVPFVFLRGRRTLVIVPVLALLVAVAAPNLLAERFATLTTSGGEASSRLDIWHSAVSIWQTHPIAGVGLGSFPQAYASARIPGKAFLPQTIFEPPPHAHNLFFHTLAEEGLVGLLVLIGLLVLAGRTAWRMRRRSDRWSSVMGAGMLAAVVAFVVHNFFDVTLFDGSTAFYFWTLLGLICALPRVEGDPENAPEPDAKPSGELVPVPG